METLFIGDIVDAEAARWVASRVPRLREELALDWVVGNSENCVVTGPRTNDGFGLSVEVVGELIGGGVDLITGGNHTWDGPEVAQVLGYDEVLRPANVDEQAGWGVATLNSGAETLTVSTCSAPLRCCCRACWRRSRTRCRSRGCSWAPRAPHR